MTGSGPMLMCGDIFVAATLWRGRLLTTGHLSSSHPVVVGAGDVLWGSLRRGGRNVAVLQVMLCHLREGFHQFKSFVEMQTVRCCPLWHPAYCPMGTVPRVLVWRTVSPAHAHFVGLSSGTPSCRPTRHSVFSVQLFCVNVGGLTVGWISCWT